MQGAGLAQRAALRVLQRDAGDLGGTGATLQELWTQSYWWDQAADASSQKDTKGQSEGRHQEETCELVSWSSASSRSPRASSAAPESGN